MEKDSRQKLSSVIRYYSDSFDEGVRLKSGLGRLEEEKSLVGASPHLLAVAWKAGTLARR